MEASADTQAPWAFLSANAASLVTCWVQGSPGRSSPRTRQAGQGGTTGGQTGALQVEDSAQGGPGTAVSSRLAPTWLRPLKARCRRGVGRPEPRAECAWGPALLIPVLPATLTHLRKGQEWSPRFSGDRSLVMMEAALARAPGRSDPQVTPVRAPGRKPSPRSPPRGLQAAATPRSPPRGLRAAAPPASGTASAPCPLPRALAAAVTGPCSRHHRHASRSRRRSPRPGCGQVGLLRPPP